MTLEAMQYTIFRLNMEKVEVPKGYFYVDNSLYLCLGKAVIQVSQQIHTDIKTYSSFGDLINDSAPNL